MHAQGQSFPNFRFQQITEKDGLSSNLIQGVMEDKSGFIWIGTANGLNRVEGQSIRQFFHDEQNSRSISGNRIFYMWCDRKGNCWFGTTSGMSCFVRDSNYFINYTVRESVPGRKLTAEGICNPYEDASGQMYFVQYESGVYKVNPDFSVTKTDADPEPFTYAGYSYRHFYGICRDSTGSEWAFSGSRLYALDLKTKKPVQTYDLSSYLPYNNGINQLYADANGKLVVSAWLDGARLFDPVTKTVRTVNQPYTKVPVVSSYRSWKYEGQAWNLFTSVNTGLVVFDSAYNKYAVYNEREMDPNSIRGYEFNGAFTDHLNNLWVATNSGINLFIASAPSFSVFPLTNPGQPLYSPQYNGAPFGFGEVNGQFWVNKRYFGTFVFDSSISLQKFFYSLYPLSATKENSTHSAYVFYNRGDECYITTDSGLVVLDKKRLTTRLFCPDAHGLVADFRDIIPLNDEEIMIRSYSAGIYVFNTVLKKYTAGYSVPEICEKCLRRLIYSLYRTREGRIFLGGGISGLFEYSKKEGRFLKVPVKNNLPGEGAFTIPVFKIEEDKEGKIWWTSTTGVYVMDPATLKITAHHTGENKMGETWYVKSDPDDNIWISAYSGIWCYNRAAGNWLRFTKTDGLPGDDFENGIYVDRHGDVWAGVQGAMVRFNRKALSNTRPSFNMMITEAEAGTLSWLFPAVENRSKEIALPPGVRSVSVSFSLLEYTDRWRNKFYYKLSPLMNEFKQNPDGHLNFAGLTPGNYILYVKGADRYGNFTSAEDSLRIYVKPWWYQTLFFRILVVLALSALIYGFYIMRVRNIRRVAGFRQRVAETEMQALRAQMNPHFIFNSLNSIENFMMLNEKRKASDYLNKFSRLIRSILDSSRNEKTLFSMDMEALRLYVELELLRFDNKFRYETAIDPQLMQGDFRVPSLLIQPYVENSIVHGLAHSDRNDLYLKVTAAAEGELIHYTIEDNGIGRAQAALYNVKNRPRHVSVGLRITEDRVQLHNKGEDIKEAIRITDLTDADGQPAGTRVEIFIKAS